MAQRHNVQAERSSLENCQQNTITTEGARDRRDTWGRVARFTVVAIKQFAILLLLGSALFSKFSPSRSGALLQLPISRLLVWAIS